MRRLKPVTISRRAGGILACLATVVVVYGAVTLIGRSRGTAGAYWPLAVTAGACTSSGLIVLLGALAAVAWRRPRASRVLVRAMTGLAGAALLITSAGVHIVGTSTPPGPWEVGLAAFILPVACLALVLIPLLTWRGRPSGPVRPGPDVRRVLVATITAREDAWAVHWTGIGHTPRALTAATLTAAAGQALTAASAPHPRNATELRIVIYPGPYRGGPAFDITGEPGDLAVASTHHPGQTFRSATLEDLTGAIEQTLTDVRSGYRLRWTRHITAPAASAPSPDQLPPGEEQPTPGDHSAS